MPIYEFYCPDNNKLYSFYARSLAMSDKTPRCPDDPKLKMRKVVSSFAVTGRAKEKPDLPPGAESAEDAKMEAAMMEMEREFGSMDSENPDPKMLARMMRKMSAITGEKMPGEMDEMIRRMEAGEDPEKLEEEYGDAFGDEGPEGGMPGMPGAEEKDPGLKEQLRRLRRRPQRDKTLYEMSEFV